MNDLSIKSSPDSLNVKFVFKLDNLHARNIYKFLYKYKERGVCSIPIKEFKLALGLVDAKTREERYINFSLFSRCVLEVAQHEINNYTDLSFTYTPQKLGGKVIGLSFTIYAKPA